MSQSQPRNILFRNPLFLYCAIALLILAIVTVHTYHFADHNYRQDEAWAIHRAILRVEERGLLSHTLDSLINYTTENFVLDIWVTLFGHTEPITRFLSTLYTALGLAFLYRLGTDLFDRKVGVLSVFILGSLSFFQFFAHETRPYTALVAGTIAFQFFFLRYLRCQRLKYGVPALFVALIGIYQHLFIAYVIASQVIFWVLFVPLNRRIYLRVLGLFALIGLLSIPRLLANLNFYQGGIGYGLLNEWNSVRIVFDQIQIKPEALGQMLALTGLLLPAGYLFKKGNVNGFRFGLEWPKLYIIFVLVSIVVMTVLSNLMFRNVTPRNLIILLPPLAILVAFALRHFPWQAQAVIVVFITIPFLTTFKMYIHNTGYREAIEFMKPYYEPEDSRVVVLAQLNWEHPPLIYYLRERTSFGLENEDLFHIYGERLRLDTWPEVPVNNQFGFGVENRQRLLDFLGGSRQLWLIEGSGWPVGDSYVDLIEEIYYPHRSMVTDEGDYMPMLTVTEYRRIPDDLSDIFFFGEHISLQQWQLQDSVQVSACQTITLESWWQTSNSLDTNYSTTLVITDTDGQGIVQTDDIPADVFTQQWLPEHPYLDERTVTIPCDTPPGEYMLLTGVYDYETVESLAVATPDGVPLGELAYLTTLFVGGE